MKKGPSACFAALAACVLVSLPYRAPAQGPPDKTPGWSARVQAGAGYFSSTDQLNTRADDVVRDLGDDADSFDRVLPLGLADIRYSFFGSPNEIYFGTPIETSGPPALQLGLAHTLGDGGKLDLSVSLNPFTEVWKDPYLVGVDREETDQDSYGMTIAWQKIFGSRFEVSYSLTREDVDDDRIGDREESLERDGWVHEADLAYSFPLGRGLSLVPSLELALGDLDGGANSYTGYGFQLALRRFSGDYGVNIALKAGVDDYDGDHPIFGKTREDTNYGAFGMVTRNGLFGRDPLSATLLAGYSRRDSNIGFLDAETLIAGLMLGYRF